MRKQLAFFLARAQIPVSWVHCSDPESYVAPEPSHTSLAVSGSKSSISSSAANSILATPPAELDDDLLECLGNLKLSDHFKRFGKELDVFDPKSLEDIYKTHLDNTRESLALCQGFR
jgi:26S proteasome regulatory subunit N1